MNNDDLLSANSIASSAVTLMNDFYRDHFKKERIFHGNGAGFFGKLIIENDISTYTSCKLFKNKEVNVCRTQSIKGFTNYYVPEKTSTFFSTDLLTTKKAPKDMDTIIQQIGFDGEKIKEK